MGSRYINGMKEGGKQAVQAIIFAAIETGEPVTVHSLPTDNRGEAETWVMWGEDAFHPAPLKWVDARQQRFQEGT